MDKPHPVTIVIHMLNVRFSVWNNNKHGIINTVLLMIHNKIIYYRIYFKFNKGKMLLLFF